MDAVTIVDPFGLGRRALALGEGVLLAAVDRVVHDAIQGGLVQRVVEELLAEGVVEQVSERVLTGPELELLADRVVTGPEAERLVGQVLDSPLLDASVTRVLASRELWLMIEEIARSPAVTEAISHQSAGFADQVVGQVGDSTRRADAWLERAARRMLHRPPVDAAPVVP